MSWRPPLLRKKLSCSPGSHPIKLFTVVIYSLLRQVRLSTSPTLIQVKYLWPRLRTYIKSGGPTYVGFSVLIKCYITHQGDLFRGRHLANIKLGWVGQVVTNTQSLKRYRISNDRKKFYDRLARLVKIYSLLTASLVAKCVLERQLFEETVYLILNKNACLIVVDRSLDYSVIKSSSLIGYLILLSIVRTFKH